MDGKSVSVKQYDGLSDPKGFKKSFTLNALMLNWDDGRKISILPHLLIGRAERVYNEMADEDKTDVAKIFEALEKNCVQSTEVLLHAFNTRKPGLNETLSSYARDLQELLEKAVPSLGLREKNIFLRNKLAESLPEHMRALIKFNSDKSWDDLLKCLDEALPHVKAFASGSGQSYDGASGTNFKFEAESIKTEPEDIEANTLQSRKFTGACFFCKKSGHRKVDCYKFKRYTERQNDNKKDNSKSNSSGSFYNKSKSVRFDLDGAEDDHDFNAIDLEVNKEDLTINMSNIVSNVNLINKKCKIVLKNDKFKHNLSALFDGGATNSLVKFGKLSVEIQKEITNFIGTGVDSNGRDFKRIQVKINGVTGSVSETCVSVPVLVMIGKWSGVHNVIVTNSLETKDVILGRDFLKRFGVIIDHGNDTVSIDVNSNDIKNWDHELGQFACVSLNQVVLEPLSESLVVCKSLNATPNKDLVLTPKLEES